MVRQLLLAVAFGFLMSAVSAQDAAPTERDTTGQPPNVVLIFTDDQGYGDLSCQGHPTIHTPRIDQLAAEGTKFSQFYVASPVCSPSRAALLTGCYPKRVGMHKHVIFPEYDYGLHTEEVTIADALRAAGYATGCFGKWHLGHREGMLPTDQGFDRFFGVPYSNDMAQIHRKQPNKYRFRLPLMRDKAVLEWEPDQRLLTRRYTDAAIEFVTEHKDQPFFVYLPHSMPHIPLYASKEHKGTSVRGLYGDVIEEIDANVGRLLDTLESLSLRERTLVIFASDNGPWLQFKARGGSAGPLRGGKGTNFEGGQRVPCIMSWPGQVPSGRLCRQVVTAMDVLPTLARLASVRLNPDRTLDGKDCSDLLLGKEGGDAEAREFVYYTSRGALAGIRRGPWKLMLPKAKESAPQLFHVEHDVGEKRNVAGKHADLVAELAARARGLDEEITAAARPVLRSDQKVFDPQK